MNKQEHDLECHQSLCLLEAGGEQDEAGTEQGDENLDDDGLDSDVDLDEIAQDDRKTDFGKRRLRRRPTEEQSARVFSNQLRGMSESDKYVKKIDD